MAKVFGTQYGKQLGLFTETCSTEGDLALWLDNKPAQIVAQYMFYGEGFYERMACLNSLIRREIIHLRDHHHDWKMYND